MKVVINRRFGGFGLSNEACEYLGISPKEAYDYSSYNMRTDPDLVDCVEHLGSERASGSFAKLKVVEIPDDVKWEITDYDGMEQVEEVHRVWY